MTGIIYQGLSSAVSSASSTLIYAQDRAVSALSDTTSYVAAASLSALKGAYNVGAYALNTTYSSLCSVGKSAVTGIVTLTRPIASYFLPERVDALVRRKIAAIHLPGANASAFIKSKIQASSKLSSIEKHAARNIVDPLISGIKWTRDIDSFKALTLYATGTLVQYTGALRLPNVTEAGKIYVTIMRAYEMAVENGEDSFVLASLEQTLKSTRTSYEEALTHALGYDSIAALEKQTLKSVGKHAGRFVTNPSERGKIIRAICSIFENIYIMIVGHIAKHVLKKKISKLDQLTKKLHPTIDKALKKVSSEERRGDIKILAGAQAKIFALHALESLMNQRKNIFNGESPHSTTFNSDARDNLSSVVEGLVGAFVPGGDVIREQLSSLVLDRIQELDFESAIEQLHSKLSPWLSP